MKLPRDLMERLRSGAWPLRQLNTPATGTTPLNSCIAEALPALTDELEHRSAGTVLVLSRH